MGKQQVVVITGASSGIGRATAERYARRGASLVLAARAREPLEEVAAACRARGARTLVTPVDVTDSAAVEALAEAAVATFGRIDVWVCSAGVVGYGMFETIPAESFRRIVEVNFFGQVHCARAVLPHFRRQGRGKLVLVGSLYSAVTSPYMSAYTSSKHAVRSFARTLRQELRGTPRIRITAVHPATIDTPIYQRAANYTGHGSHPLPPIVAPERVAAAIVRSGFRREVFVGRVQRMALTPLQMLLPAVYDTGVGPAMRILGLRGRAPERDGNLFVPASDAPVTGGWRSGKVRFALAAALTGGLWLMRIRRVRPGAPR